MGQLGGLVSTPRAAKRMVNIYRLARIGYHRCLEEPRQVAIV
jgi:hypothetical protein